jgi:hypothetical protein
MRATRAAMVTTIWAAAVLGGIAGSPPPATITVTGGTWGHHELAGWAMERFADAGLVLPNLDIRFHGDRQACADHLGYYDDGVVRSCHRHLNEMAAGGLLHEMAHGWVDAYLPQDVRSRFMELRDLRTWNDWDVEWDARGTEQAAEIIAWAVGDQGDGTRAPSFPENSRRELAAAYRVLTGRPLPNLVPADLWLEDR